MNEWVNEPAKEHIDTFEKKCKLILIELKHSISLLKELDLEDAHEFYMLTAMFEATVYKAYLEWCK